jgi:hypothetical protein
VWQTTTKILCEQKNKTTMPVGSGALLGIRSTTNKNMKIEYRKDEVWLCDWGGEREPLTILEISGGFVRHKHGWDSSAEWHKRVLQKLGKVRRIMGIKVGLTR